MYLQIDTRDTIRSCTVCVPGFCAGCDQMGAMSDGVSYAYYFTFLGSAHKATRQPGWKVCEEKMIVPGYEDGRSDTHAW